jgi:PhzF family phenazine biosynthesis protein
MKIWQVDAFTKKIFSGNPAAVCLVEKFLDDQQMQQIASELNLSETAFVKHLNENHFHIRWFSPLDEAPICGHATLAASHILWEKYDIKDKLIIFDSLSGPLTAEKKDDWITLNFPAKKIAPAPMTEQLNKALGYCQVTAVYKDDLIYVVVLPDAKSVVDFKPNLQKISQLNCRAVTITALNEGFLDHKIDFVSRYFAPKVGIPEDPVCGSAHCRLVPFWSEQLNTQKEFLCYQASRRGGLIKAKFENDRVTISGQSITVSEIELELD